MALNRFRFSFIMPVYNVEEYLEEAIDSIIGQTMKFEDHIQIILINDGSPDDSGEICERYARLYPDNIVYIAQKNAGVSAARNVGLSAAKGEFIGFVDSDDKISDDTLETVYNFFQKHPDTDVVSIKMELFGRVSGSHISNDKFASGDRVIDLSKEYIYRQNTIGNAFIRSLALEGERFNTKLKRNEDNLFLTNIIKDKLTLGVVSGPTYFYRKRLDESSAVDMSKNDLSWYTTALDEFYKPLMDGTPSLYVQNIVFYDLIWRFKQESRPLWLDQDIFDQYKNRLKELVCKIDDRVLASSIKISIEHKMHLLSIKHGDEIESVVSVGERGEIVASENTLYNSPRMVRFYIDRMNVVKDNLYIEGYHTGLRNKDIQYVIKNNDQSSELDYDTTRVDDSVYSLDDLIYRRNCFKSVIKLHGNDNITFGYIVGGERYFTSRFIPSLFTGLTTELSYSYKVSKSGGRILSAIDERFLHIQAYTKLAEFKKFLKMQVFLLKLGKSSVSLTRAWYVLLKTLFGGLRIWLISDRSYTVGDNAEYFFEYIARNKLKRFAFFAVDKNTDDYKRLRRNYGWRVVGYDTILYRLIFIISDKRISSHFDRYIYDAFGESNVYYRDLYTFDYVYLEHGVLASDSSRLLSKTKLNARLITLASHTEKAAILSNEKYGYTENELVVTGHPRLDALIDTEPKRKVVIMPTWRSKIAGPVEYRNGIPSGMRLYSENFKQTDYYRSYEQLINSEKFLKMLDKYDYSVEFYIHPSLSAQWQDFKGSRRVKIMRPPHNYERALSEGAIMVTDYSGVAFDFAYQQKPLVYFHFDYDTLFKTHYYEKGTFDYSVDGFGPIAKTVDEVIKMIKSYIRSDCLVDEVYKKRSDSFFNYRDKGSSKRIYDAIVGIDQEDYEA